MISIKNEKEKNRKERKYQNHHLWGIFLLKDPLSWSSYFNEICTCIPSHGVNYVSYLGLGWKATGLGESRKFRVVHPPDNWNKVWMHVSRHILAWGGNCLFLQARLKLSCWVQDSLLHFCPQEHAVANNCWCLTPGIAVSSPFSPAWRGRFPFSQRAMSEECSLLGRKRKTSKAWGQGHGTPFLIPSIDSWYLVMSEGQGTALCKVTWGKIREGFVFTNILPKVSTI